MFDPKSRYHDLPRRHYREAGGGEVVYVSRRFLSRAEGRPVLAEAEVRPGDRPDLLAGRTLRQPTLFWRVCDANGAMHPFDLTRWPGRRLRIHAP